MADAQTNENGDFVFPNVPGDTYTVEVTLEGFKTLRRAGVLVSPGDRVVVPTMTLSVGGLGETVNVKAEAPTIQAASGERAFTVTTESVENLPIANRNFAGFATLVPGAIAQTRDRDRRRRHPAGRRRPEQHHDGRRVDDGHREQRAVDPDERRLDRRGEGADAGLPGRVRAVERPADLGGHQERHQPVSAARSTTSSGTRTGTRTAGRTSQNGDPKPVSKQRDWGYSLGGPIGKPGGANRLFFFYSHEYRPREAGGDINRFRVPTVLERQGDFSQTRDNNGALFNTIRDYTTGLPCTAADTRGCFQDGGVLGRIPQSRLYPTGMNILSKLWPLPNVEQVPGLGYNFEVQVPVTQLAAAPAGAPRRLSGLLDAALHGEIRRAAAGPGHRSRAAFPGSTTCCGGTGTGMRRRSRSTTTCPDDVPRGHVRLQLQRDCQSVREPAVEPRERRARRTCRCCSRRPDWSIRPTTPRACSAPPNSPFFIDGRVMYPPNFSWGNRIANAPPNLGAQLANINPSHDASFSLTKLAGRHTLKAGLLLEPRLQGAAARHRGSDAIPGRAQLRQRHAESARQRLRLRQRRARHPLARMRSSRSWSRADTSTTTSIGTLQDNWKVSNKLTLDYGMRFVYMQPTYDTRIQASTFFHRSMAGGAGAAALCDWVRGCAAVLGDQPSGDGSPVPVSCSAPRSGGAHRTDRAELRELS